MGELLPLILALGPIGILLYALVYLISHPDTAYRWGEIFWTLASKVYKAGDRKAVQYGLQGRVDRFAKELAHETGKPQPAPIRIQWTDQAEEQRHFFDDNRLVVRVHRHERQDRNLVTTSLLIVAETMAKERSGSCRNRRPGPRTCTRSTSSWLTRPRLRSSSMKRSWASKPMRAPRSGR
jgi:hypothetical protein